ncbi:MAG TPA: hypothetical protein VHX36_01360 [Candidatus Acidoferrales bacterium]|nr:hypothetical protein [Candidatus Acidoferrales bacterium]
MTRDQRQALLNSLKLELQLCEKSGNQTIVENAPSCENDSFSSPEGMPELRKERSAFQDSLSGPGDRLPILEHPCPGSWPIHFVLAETLHASVPRHHVPLDEGGEAFADLGADARELQEIIRGWLRAKIHELESEVE